MSDLLDRFHRVLVQEIRKNRPEYLEGRFTVAEIYQNLVYDCGRAISIVMEGTPSGPPYLESAKACRANSGS